MLKWILTSALTLTTVSVGAQSWQGQEDAQGRGRPSRPHRPTPSKPVQRIELREVIRAVGYDFRDCDYRMERQTYQAEQRLLRSCENQSRSRCYISSKRHLGGGYIYPVTGTYRVDDYKTDERKCRSKAADRSEDAAISSCQSEYGVRCRLTRRGDSNHKIERRRRYGIMGPKENFHVCKGQAQAAPEANYREQCSMEIRVSN